MFNKKQKFYSLKNILSKNAIYNIIFGERSNGKTYSVLEYGLKEYFKTGRQLGIIRRWLDDFKGKRGQTLFDGIVGNDVINKLSNGEYNGVYYYSQKWYLCKWENGEKTVSDEPFAYAFALTSTEHDKSTSYPKIGTILFDEFLTRSAYLPDEFILFMNTISTIVRNRNDVKIFMLGNTVNKYCPYFGEMGLTHIKSMEIGTIDVYQYGHSELRVAVEYCKPNAEGKASDLYFAFNNPKLQMITGGAWEVDIYPHLPIKYQPKNIKLIYFINFDDTLLQCEIIKIDKNVFTYIHEKTTPLKNPKTDIIYSTDYSPQPNYSRLINKPTNKLQKLIYSFFQSDKVFYSSNEIGEVVRNYLVWCNKN